MKRRVNQVGTGTLTVSLPAKWTKINNIKKGQEIEIACKNERLEISITEKIENTKKFTLDLNELNERAIRWILSVLHKSGYDEIEILYYGTEHTKIIEEMLKELMTGFVIVDQTEKKCLLKNITKEVDEDFNPVLRRAFLVTLSLAENSLKLIEEKKLRELMTLNTLEKTNNQLTNFCERIINKRKYEREEKSHFIYVIIWNLEKLADDYNSICTILAESKHQKMGKDTIELYIKTNKTLRLYYETFFRFNYENLVEIAENRKKICKNIYEAIEKSNKTEKEVLINLYSIIQRIADLCPSTIGLNQQEP
jgi:phosphate uptake regulator